MVIHVPISVLIFGTKLHYIIYKVTYCYQNIFVINPYKINQRFENNYKIYQWERNDCTDFTDFIKRLSKSTHLI